MNYGLKLSILYILLNFKFIIKKGVKYIEKERAINV